MLAAFRGAARQAFTQGVPSLGGPARRPYSLVVPYVIEKVVSERVRAVAPSAALLWPASPGGREALACAAARSCLQLSNARPARLDGRRRARL